MGRLEENRRNIISSQPHLETTTGIMNSFNTDLPIPIKQIRANIPYKQAGSGTPSPSNTRAFSGFTTLKLYTAGVNLAPPMTAVTNNNGITTTINADGTVTVNGRYTRTSTGAMGNYSSYYYLPAGSYYLSGGYSTYFRVQAYDSNGNGNGYSTSASTPTSYEPATPYSGYIRLYIYYKSPMPEANNIILYPMMRLQAQGDGTFVKYEGTQDSYSWSSTAGTIYGGYLDPINGTITVTHAKASCDGTIDFDYGALEYTSRFAKKITALGFAAPKAEQQLVPFNYLASNDSISTEWSGHIRENGIVYIYFPKSYNSKTALSNYLSQHPLEFVYELAEPVTYTLTGKTFTALKGYNNIWTNAGGNVEVTYWTH